MSAAELNTDIRSTLSYAQAVAASQSTNESSTNTTIESASSATDGSAEPLETGAANPVPETETSAANTNSGAVSLPVVESATESEAPTSESSTSEVTGTNNSTSGNGGVETVDLSGTTVTESTLGETFTSHTSAGFEGMVLEDGSVQLNWNADPSARGYNLYRDAEFVASVSVGTEWIDTDTTDGSYYYEIEAYDFVPNLERIATGLTVKVSGSGRENPSAKTAAGVDLAEYELVFAEEFQGDSLDYSKWSTSYMWGPTIFVNSEEQYYVDTQNDPNFGFDPFTFDGENMTINSIRTPDALLDKAEDQPYLSGVITSRDSFNFTYGYVEARAKMPYGQGFWAAFWLLNTVYDRGDEPEIDIMEFIGDDQDVVYHTYHYYDHFVDSEVLHSTDSMPVAGIDFTADFHTFAVDWRPGTLVFYVNGIETHRITDSRVSSVDMYIIANTALGGWWPGSPDETTEFPGEFELDYIRVYQKLTPYEDRPLFNDQPSTVPVADNLQGTSPNHRPTFAQWPEGYPGRTRTAD